MSLAKKYSKFKVFSESHSILENALDNFILYDMKILYIQKSYFLLQTKRQMFPHTLYRVLSQHINFEKIEIYMDEQMNEEQKSVEKEFYEILIKISRDYTYYDSLIANSDEVDDHLWLYLNEKHTILKEAREKSFDIYHEKEEILKKQENLPKFQATQEEKELPDLGFSFIENNSSAEDSSTQNNSFEKIMLENSGNTSTDQVGEEEKNQAPLQNTQKDEKNQTRHEISIDSHIKEIRMSRSKSFDHKERPETPLKKAPTHNKNILEEQSEQNE